MQEAAHFLTFLDGVAKSPKLIPSVHLRNAFFRVVPLPDGRSVTVQKPRALIAYCHLLSAFRGDKWNCFFRNVFGLGPCKKRLIFPFLIPFAKF